MTVNILAVGDLVGQSGLDKLSACLRSFQKQKNISFTVVNGENVSGVGLTARQSEDILNAGADVITLGNHAFSKSSVFEFLDDSPYILRPANYASQAPGRGCGVYDASFGQVRVINLIGRCGMDFGPDNPFSTADTLLRRQEVKITLVDMHAEATSEKLAMGYYLDGRVSAVWGTHTHVQTSDGQVLPRGTGYITDLGMTGPALSVLGVRPEQSIAMFLGNPGRRFESAPGPAKLEAAVFSVDTSTGLCRGVEAVRLL